METDLYRPRLHFTPERYFINDPNGLLYDGEKWHLFAQHLAYSFSEGEKHWYHAVSHDLVHWEYLPIALYPDELGQIFSGSAVCDEHNTSGFGEAGRPPIVAMFTHHGASQQQSIAYSTDGIHFTKYAGNPVISNTEKVDFRDPKMIWNPILRCWTVVVAAGDHVEFFASPDLIHWEQTGVFYAEDPDFKGVWECPDLFVLKDQDGTEHWVLIVSLVEEWDKAKIKTCYHIGEFDGKTFSVESGRPHRLDEGWDNYASVSFYGAPDGGIVLLGWNMIWSYFFWVPTDRFRGLYTLPRICSLRKCGAETLLCQLPYPTVKEQFEEPVAIADTLSLHTETFKITLTAAGDFLLCLKTAEGAMLKIGLQGDTLTFDRTDCTAFIPDQKLRDFVSRSECARKMQEECHLEVYFDVCTCEIFADEGSIAMTNLVYPPASFTEVTVTGDAQAVFSKIKA